jgi:hypothetical protein
MRAVVGILVMATGCFGQSLVENSAAAAGGSVGGVAGRKVGEGIANIFNKVDKAAGKAAKTGDTPSNPPPGAMGNEPLIEVGPGVPRGESMVPPPPPVKRTPVRRASHVAAPVPVVAPVVAAPLAAPAPQVTIDDLHKMTAGMARANVLSMGEPAVRITMIDDGRLLEIYRYMEKDSTIGAVRLVDGSVERVDAR